MQPEMHAALEPLVPAAFCNLNEHNAHRHVCIKPVTAPAAPPGMERLLAPQRRVYLLTTLAIVTLTYTWSSVNRLAELIEAEPDLPSESSILKRAEHNIASHLHLHGVGSEQCAAGEPQAGTRIAAAAAASLCCLLHCSPSHVVRNAEFRGMVGNELPEGAGGWQQQLPWAKKRGAGDAAAGGVAAGGSAAAAGSTAATAAAKKPVTVQPGQCNMLNNTECVLFGSCCCCRRRYCWSLAACIL